MQLDGDVLKYDWNRNVIRNMSISGSKTQCNFLLRTLRNPYSENNIVRVYGIRVDAFEQNQRGTKNISENFHTVEPWIETIAYP